MLIAVFPMPMDRHLTYADLRDVKRLYISGQSGSGLFLDRITADKIIPPPFYRQPAVLRFLP